MSGPLELLDWDEREPLQRGVHRFVTTWHEGMDFHYEGANLGECLEYNLTQLCNHRILADLQRRKQETKSDPS